MIYVFLADGFEEIEALAPVDILRRGGKDVKTVAIKGKSAVGAHGLEVLADITFDKIKDDVEMIVLPGGMPGTKNLAKFQPLASLIMNLSDEVYIGAICAAPSILGELGLLKEKQATCFPGFEGYLNCLEYSEESVVKDGNIITAKGAGVALDFGFELLSVFSKEKAETLRKEMQSK